MALINSNSITDHTADGKTGVCCRHRSHLFAGIAWDGREFLCGAVRLYKEKEQKKILVKSTCFRIAMRSYGVERAKGIEPSYAAWEAAVLPLNYARTVSRLPYLSTFFKTAWFLLALAAQSSADNEFSYTGFRFAIATRSRAGGYRGSKRRCGPFHKLTLNPYFRCPSTLRAAESQCRRESSRDRAIGSNRSRGQCPACRSGTLLRDDL